MTQAFDDDPRFLAALRRREERAFNRLVLMYQDRVYNLIYRLVGSEEEARDVAQEVFVTIFQKIELFRGDSKLSTWVFRVAANHAKNRIKYLSRRHDRKKDNFEDMTVEVSSGRLNASIPRPDQMLDSSRLEVFLEGAMQALDEDQRTLIVLRDMESLTYEEIAEVTGLNLGTIKSRLHRGRMRLKEALDDWMAGREPGASDGAQKRIA